ncbi:MAG: CCA tRNA nucleotidyltransferase [Planctomycetota bacterium]
MHKGKGEAEATRLVKDCPPPEATALGILRALRRAGHEAYFCGGCVRDMLLGRAPVDWDIATSATPEAIEGLFPKTVGVGRAFGVMLVREAGRQVEVATFRADSPSGDGRRPDAVRFSSAREDVLRRDFTVNGLLYDPEGRTILDFVRGREDLERRLVRAIGDPGRRFSEDHLRLLRAVRFAAALEFELEAETRAAVQRLAGLARLVSAERTAGELTRMLTSGHAGRALRLLEETHLLLHVLPEVASLRGLPQPEAFHPEGDVFTHTALMLDALPAGSDPALAWAALLHDVGKAGTLSLTDRIRFHEHPEEGARSSRAILERLRRPSVLVEGVTALVRGHMRLASLQEMREAKRRRALRDPLFSLHLELHRLDCLASHGDLAPYEYALRAWEEERARPEPEAPLLTGHDLIALGHAPGPRFSVILEAVEDARLEGRLATREEALAFVRETMPPGNSA